MLFAVCLVLGEKEHGRREGFNIISRGDGTLYGGFIMVRVFCFLSFFCQ
jgi:hypothetical protein